MIQRSNQQEKFSRLRKEFEFFVFEKQEYTFASGGLDIRFTFSLADKHKFHPTLFIPWKPGFPADEHVIDSLSNIIFNIGMIELISYWKAACPPRLVIRPFQLTPEQVKWWKKIYFHGLGEFFYLNSIHTDQDNFLDIEVASAEKFSPVHTKLEDKLLIPIGGGKDSAVTLELLSGHADLLPLVLNPRKACIDTIRAGGYSAEDFFEIRRTIDPLLLKLNEQGFLNGHTPFSALLGFITCLASLLAGRRHIVLSNESSANEPTIPGTTINHQYSKSFQFEADFREYIRSYIHPDINYFSFLRPVSELQIALLLSQFPKYHSVFRSCNAGSKSDIWCGKCSKCLFTFIMLSPFLERDKIIGIFGADLLDDADLLVYFDQLTGQDSEKPFECIGTVDEVNLALMRIIENHDGPELPFLLRHYIQGKCYHPYRSEDFDKLLRSFSPDHYLPLQYSQILKSAIDAAIDPK